MKKEILTLLAVFAAGLLHAEEPLAEIVTVRDGIIYPTNVVAEARAVAQAVAQAEAAAVQASAVEQAALMVSNAVADVTEIVNSLEGIGYIRGHVMQFGAGIQADTNMVASIVKFAPAGSDGDKSLWDIWTYFSEDPGALPRIRFADSLGRTNAWDEAEAVGTPVLDTVLVGSTEYETYRNRVSMPPEYARAFFRTFVDVQGFGTNLVYFPVRNGIAVNGTLPLTATFVDGTNTYRFVGGVRVQ